MRQRFILGIDAGQTMVKAVVHDEQLRPVSLGRHRSPIERPLPRFAERTHDELWDAAAAAISDAIRSANIDARDIAAIGISGHGDGLHLVDAAGAAVGPAITAVDSRAHAEAEEIRSDTERLRTILECSGQQPPTGGAGALLLWTARNKPELIEQAHALLFCKDVIRLRLTGEIATDLSDATAAFLDTETATWSSEILDAYGLRGLERLLPELRLSGDSGGTVTRQAAEKTGLIEGTPVIVGMHDVQANSIGMGALVPGRLAMVAGSFCTNGVTTRESHVDPRWQSRLSITPDLRIAMSTSPTASPALDWALAMLGADDEATRDALFAEAAALDPQLPVPLVLPYFFASPAGDNASATFAGVRGWHSRAHVFRGVLEGIVLMHYWHTSALGEKFSWEEPLLLGGGLSRAPLYVQLVANALRAPVAVVRTDEAGAFGAAALAAVSAGVFDSLTEAQEHVVTERPIEPTADSAAYWSDVIGSFSSLGETLDPWWRQQEGGTDVSR